MAPNHTDKGQSTGNLLKQDEREICAGLLAADNPHDQRARALLALDGGATQVQAGQISGLTKGQVRYWLGKFQKIRLSIFPPELIDRQANLQADKSAQESEDLNIAESGPEKPSEVKIEEPPEETGTFSDTSSEKREVEKSEDKAGAQGRKRTKKNSKKKGKKKTKKKSNKKSPPKKKKGSKMGKRDAPSKKGKESKGKKKDKDKKGKKKSKKKKSSKKAKKKAKDKE